MKQLLEAENIDEKRWPARVLAMLIDGWKNRGLTPEQVPAGEAARFRQRQRPQALQGLSGAAENSQRRRFRRSAAGEHPAVPRAAEVLRQYQARFKYILVDEYQDTNVAQYLWLRLLAQRTGPSTASQAGAPRRVSPQSVSGKRIAGSLPGGAPRNDGVEARTPKTSAASATTTSRSMAGAAPRSTTSCASSTIFPAPR